MYQSCSIHKCVRKPRGLCDCCQQRLCLQHLNEHNASLISQLNPLIDELNCLSHRLKTLNIEDKLYNSRQQLEQWREDCYKKIDVLFETKYAELTEFVNKEVEKQQGELNRIHSRITELIETEEATRRDVDWLASHMYQLKRNMTNIEQSRFQIDIHPWHLDEGLLVVKTIVEQDINLSSMSSVWKQMSRPRSSFGTLACNERHLLMSEHSNLSLLDQEMNTFRTVPWHLGKIRDMCWSLTLERFIILGENKIFLLNENTMSIDTVETIAEERKWQTCTCSDKYFYASTNKRATCIKEFTLLPVLQLNKEWKHPVTCTGDENIDAIAFCNGNIALLIMNNNDRSVRIEVRCTDLLDRIWSLQLDIVSTKNMAFRCCSLPSDEWLISDYETGHLLHVSKDGFIKNRVPYKPNPYCCIIFASNKLAVLVSSCMNVHILQ